jgi:hypothetical protein
MLVGTSLTGTFFKLIVNVPLYPVVLLFVFEELDNTKLVSAWVCFIVPSGLTISIVALDAPKDLWFRCLFGYLG